MLGKDYSGVTEAAIVSFPCAATGEIIYLFEAALNIMFSRVRPIAGFRQLVARNHSYAAASRMVGDREPCEYSCIGAIACGEAL